MPRLTVLFTVAVLPGLVCAQAKAPKPASEDKGTYLGILFAPVSTDKAAPVPLAGVQITHILPDSPADRAGLRRNDVLVEYDTHKVRDCEHLARLIHDDRPERKVKLSILRDGNPLGRVDKA